MDKLLSEPVDLHCIGGFVVSQHYGFDRTTLDLDVLAVMPSDTRERLLELAGIESRLAAKHGVYVDQVWVANYPDSYADRVVRTFPVWENVRLWALEAHDLALTKIERSSGRDMDDVVYLAQAGLINQATLLHRCETELEPYIVGRTPTWHQTTLKMWIDACWPER